MRLCSTGVPWASESLWRQGHLFPSAAYDHHMRLSCGIEAIGRLGALAWEMG